jgi:sulfide:quinone oxidoreductase
MLALNAISYSGADVHLFSPDPRFTLRPLSVSSGFGRRGLLTYDLANLTETARAGFHNLSVSEVDVASRSLRLSDGTGFDYDYLIASPGTKPVPAVPGAVTYWGPAGNESVSEAVEELRGRDGVKVVVTVPDGGSWPLPLYELALMIADQLAPAAAVTIVTPEGAPLGLFGEASAERVAAVLDDWNITTRLETSPAEFRDGALSTSDGERIEADLAIALPLLTGRRIPGLPSDGQGFIPVDEYGRIEGHEREYAAGDVISFPVKFGGLAAEQADIVAAAIAADAWREPKPQPLSPVYRGSLVTPDGTIGLGAGSDDSTPYAWDPSGKIVGKFLTPFLKAADPATTGPSGETGN